MEQQSDSQKSYSSFCPFQIYQFQQTVKAQTEKLKPQKEQFDSSYNEDSGSNYHQYRAKQTDPPKQEIIEMTKSNLVSNYCRFRKGNKIFIVHEKIIQENMEKEKQRLEKENHEYSESSSSQDPQK